MNQKNPPQVLRSEMRADSVPVDEHYSTEGYFYDNPILTRTGIFKYKLEDGSERRELRRPEDVFDPVSLASYEGKPIIITHDAQVIDKDNARRERVGTILTPGQQDGETVRAKIVIDDPDAVKASGLRELSVGYYQDLIMEPGEWEGEPYDAIQTHIRVNHLALVAVARAGDDARLNMDGQDNGGTDPMDDENKKTCTTIPNMPGSAACTSNWAAEIFGPGNLKKSTSGYPQRLYNAALQGALGINQDGIFGANTEKAVKAFQAAHNLTADGIVGTQTKAALSKLL